MTAPILSSATEGAGVHPTQIYESAASLAIAALCLYVVHPRKRYDGQVFLVFVVLYAAARFVIEYFRDDDRGGLVGLSTSQWIGVALVADDTISTPLCVSTLVDAHAVLDRRREV